MTDDQLEGSHDPWTVAAAYLRHHRQKNDADFWAWEEAHTYLQTDPEKAWQVLLALLFQAEWTELDYVAAGILEDLCQDHAAEFIDRIEAQAQEDPKFLAALATVWLNSWGMDARLVVRLVAASGGQLVPDSYDPADADSAWERFLRDGEPPRDV